MNLEGVLPISNGGTGSARPNADMTYLNLLTDVLNNGEEQIDRTGVGTRSVFGRQIRFDLRDSFPLITTKRVPWKPVVGELLWFIEGSSDERRLCEITFGTRDPEKKTIWSANAEYTTGSKFKPNFPGDLGRIYGVQWRTWTHYPVEGSFGDVKIIDQLANIITKIKTNPSDRRMVLTAFNVGEMDEMALPPCHMFAQFHTNQTRRELDCLVYIRSNDLFLGLPFNIASYALLTCMIAQVTGYSPGDLIVTIGDAHIYLNHLDQVKEQLSRTPFAPPTLLLNGDITDINKFTLGYESGKSDIAIVNYKSHDSIKAPMAV
jgi:thymidylate synthase